eukprot:4823072-Pleurochrysis_carterae.AAC.1
MHGFSLILRRRCIRDSLRLRLLRFRSYDRNARRRRWFASSMPQVSVSTIGTETRSGARAARQAFASRMEQPEYVGFRKGPCSGQEVSAEESQARGRLEGVRGESERRGGRIRGAEN